MLRFIFSLLLSLFLAHLAFRQFRGYSVPVTRLDYVYLALLFYLFNLFITKIHAYFYVEYFEVDPNIQEQNTQNYQEGNYEQEKAQSTSPQFEQINIFVDDNIEENAVDTRAQPGFALTRDDKEMKAQALGKAPDTQQHTYDDGTVDNTPKVDDAIMSQIQTHVRQEVAKHYANGLEDGNLAQLRPLVAQKIDERMPYLSHNIRQMVMDNLDPIIDQQLDQILGRNPSNANRIQPLTILPHDHTIPYRNHIQPLTILPHDHTIPSRNHIQPVHYSNTPPHNHNNQHFYTTPHSHGVHEHYSDNVDNGKAFYEHPRDKYRNLQPLSEFQVPMRDTHQEAVYNGKKMTSEQLFNPSRNSLQSNDMSGF